jgi:hypothetical protein
LSQRAPSNVIFKNPLLSFALCDDFEANAIFADSTVSTVCAPHIEDSRTKILIFSDQHILREKSDTDTLESVKIVSNASLLPPPSSRINNAKNHGRAPRRGGSNGENAKFFRPTHAELLSKYKNVTAVNSQNTNVTVVNQSDGDKIGVEGTVKSEIPFPTPPTTSLQWDFFPKSDIRKLSKPLCAYRSVDFCLPGIEPSLTTNAPPTHVRDETQGASQREWVKERGNPVEVAKGAFCGVECVIIPPLRLWCSDTIAVPVSTNPGSIPSMTVIARDVYPDCLMKAVAARLHEWIGDSSGAPQTGVVAATGALCILSHQTLASVLPVRGYPPQQLGDLPVSRLEISTRKEGMKFNSLAFPKAFVGLENYSLTLNDFNFASNIAPTYDQLFPHLNTQKVLIVSRGDRPLIDPKFDWIVDSRCTSHMCNNKSLFTELTPILSTITTAGEPA